MLRSHQCFAAIPGSARPLLPITREVDVVLMGSGKYFHFWLSEGLQCSIRHLKNLRNVIVIDITFDGLPLTQCTTDQFYPVLCKTMNCGASEPFPIGVYYGKGKAFCYIAFLEPSVIDLKKVLSEGIQIGTRLSQSNLKQLSVMPQQRPTFFL